MDKKLKQYLAEIGKKGGKRRLETMSDDQRREAARKAAKARWSKKKG